ncbi:MAG: PKD domain-containing protein [Methanomicrobiales archaeon]|nr:PKD domain-containing protein [Methanomicrobiales archaeon]
MRIVWMKNPHIYLLDLAGSGPAEPISTSPQGNSPRISGDRVVWYKSDSGFNNVYLHTIGSIQACPAAGFTADPPSGAAPLTVSFTDTSTGSPAHWAWDFGDGTISSGQYPSHTYTTDGSYTVTLTVGSAVGRNYTSVTNAVRVGPIPIVSFSANQSYGVAPLTVRFTDTSSGDPHSWAWDFGDGSPSVNQSQVIHTYSSPGTYPVSLSATNTNGTGTGSPRSLTVLNGLESRAATDFDWLVVDTGGPSQYIALDTTRVDRLTFDPAGDATVLSFAPPPPARWQRMTFTSADPAGFTLFPNGTITGSLGSSTLESEELIAAAFGSGLGNNLPVSCQVSFSGYPVHGEVNATVWEGMLPDDEAAARLALAGSRNFTSLIQGAYTVSLVTTGTAPVTGAGLNLSVSSAWVTANGNQNNIAAARLRDSGPNEILVPASVFSDAATGLDYFTVPSPNGASRFVLVSATGSSNLIQMGARVATQIIQGSGGRGSGSSDYQPAVRDRTPWVQPTSAPAQPPAEPAVPTFYGEARIDTTVAGITRESVIIASEDRGAEILVPAGIEALDAAGAPLTQVSMSPVAPAGVPSGAGAGTPGFAGITYDVGPDGATFSPPATLTFTLPGASWKEDTLYTLRSYDPGTGTWTEIPTTADPSARTLTGQVSHLCLFGVFEAPLPAAAMPAAPAPELTVPQPVPTAIPLPRTPMGTFTGIVAWAYATALENPLYGAALLVIAVLLSVAFIGGRRRSRITTIRRKK